MPQLKYPQGGIHFSLESCNGNTDDTQSLLHRGPEDPSRLGLKSANWSRCGLSVNISRPITWPLGQLGAVRALNPS